MKAIEFARRGGAETINLFAGAEGEPFAFPASSGCQPAAYAVRALER